MLPVATDLYALVLVTAPFWAAYSPMSWGSSIWSHSSHGPSDWRDLLGVGDRSCWSQSSHEPSDGSVIWLLVLLGVGDRPFGASARMGPQTGVTLGRRARHYTLLCAVFRIDRHSRSRMAF